MYAIVEIAGQQFKVSQGLEMFVHRLPANEGENVSFDKILLVDNDGVVRIGKPTLSGNVEATVLSHVKGDKVIIFKKKRRKGYQKMNGHRQYFTKIKINSINA